MANVHDVAAYILARYSPLTAMKLEKLAYYSQAWSLVWDETPLFAERIEAWANGPVVPALWELHRGKFTLTEWPIGNPNTLTKDQRETIDAVIRYYGPMSSQRLSDLTHLEAPWRDTRRGLAPQDRSSREITHAAMAEYYGSLK